MKYRFYRIALKSVAKLEQQLRRQRHQSGLKSGGSWIRSQKFSISSEKISDFPGKKFRLPFLVINSKNCRSSQNIKIYTYILGKFFSFSNVLSVQNWL